MSVKKCLSREHESLKPALAESAFPHMVWSVMVWAEVAEVNALLGGRA